MAYRGPVFNPHILGLFYLGPTLDVHPFSSFWLPLQSSSSLLARDHPACPFLTLFDFHEWFSFRSKLVVCVFFEFSFLPMVLLNFFFLLTSPPLFGASPFLGFAPHHWYFPPWH